MCARVPPCLVAATEFLSISNIVLLVVCEVEPVFGATSEWGTSYAGVIEWFEAFLVIWKLVPATLVTVWLARLTTLSNRVFCDYKAKFVIGCGCTAVKSLFEVPSCAMETVLDDLRPPLVVCSVI